MFASLLLKLIALITLKNSIPKQRKYLGFFIVILFYVNLILLVSYFSLQNIFGADIFEAIVFHIVFGIKGTGIDEYIAPSLLFIIFIILIAALFKPFLVYLSNDNDKNSIPLLGFSLLVLSIAFNPIIRDFYRFITISSESTDTNYFYDQKLTFSSETKNVIFLYLEQFERTYLDKNLFPDLTPNLSTLEGKGLSFTNIASPKATNWTIAGLSATQCGIPLFTPVASGSSMSGVDEFLPSANCIGDILSNLDYSLHFIGGADLDFGGKGKFFKSHGFNEIEGWYELKPQITDPTYRSPWGVYDDELLDLTYIKIKSYHDQGSPYGMFALTLDTHHPNGYLSASCQNKLYKDGSNAILNAVHCADFLAGKFINKLLNSPIMDNTTLVVLSDHYARINTATETLNKGNRKNLFLIFDKNIQPTLINKTGNMFDIGPTVMGLLGTDMKGLGLGRNLFFEDSLQKLDIDEIINLNKRKILNLWSFPQIDDGFAINLIDRRLEFGARYSQFPAILVFDNNRVEQIIYDFYYSVPLPRKIVDLNWTGAGNEDLNKNYIWIDECDKITSHLDLPDINELFCINIVDKKNNKSIVLPASDKKINKTYIEKYFN